MVTEGPCSASMGMSCQESGNSHKKGISAWMGKEQHKTSWQQVGGTATTQPQTAPCLPAARSCHHTGSRDLTAHYPQQQIFPKGEQLRRLTQFFPCCVGTPEGQTQTVGGKGTSPPTCSPGRGPTRLQQVVGPQEAAPNHAEPRPAAQPRTKTTRERSAPGIRDLASAQPFEVGSAKSDYY